MSDLSIEEDVKSLEAHIRRLAKGKNFTTFGDLFNDKEVEQTFESLV